MRARRIAVIDYGTGNLKSVVKAFEYLGANVSLTRKPEDIREIDAIVFPGQGSYDQCMNCLMQSGLDHLVKKWIQQDRPFFGICLGLQVLFESSEEGKLPGLGLFQGHVRRFVLSYKVITKDPRLTKFDTSYGETFTSGISYSNCLATQFHPEKSQSKGIQLYRNFLENIG
jgi:glutamine amidotransferase